MIFPFTFLSAEFCLLSFFNCNSVFYFIYYIIFIVKHLVMYTIRAMWKQWNIIFNLLLSLLCIDIYPQIRPPRQMFSIWEGYRTFHKSSKHAADIVNKAMWLKNKCMHNEWNDRQNFLFQCLIYFEVVMLHIWSIYIFNETWYCHLTCSWPLNRFLNLVSLSFWGDHTVAFINIIHISTASRHFISRKLRKLQLQYCKLKSKHAADIGNIIEAMWLKNNRMHNGLKWQAKFLISMSYLFWNFHATHPGNLLLEKIKISPFMFAYTP